MVYKYFAFRNLLVSPWVAGQAGIAVVAVSFYTLVVVVGRRLRVAGCCAGKYSEIRCIGMAIRTGIPLALMFPRVYREILGIVVPIGRRPGTLRVAIGTGFRKLCRSMIRIFGLVVIFGMATGTGIRCIYIIPFVAIGAGF